MFRFITRNFIRTTSAITRTIVRAVMWAITRAITWTIIRVVTWAITRTITRAVTWAITRTITRAWLTAIVIILSTLIFRAILTWFIKYFYFWIYFFFNVFSLALLSFHWCVKRNWILLINFIISIASANCLSQ